MQCKKILKVRSDWMDNLLPEKAEYEFQAHLNVCKKCADETNSLRVGLSAMKVLYGEVKAPADFSRRVMLSIKMRERKSLYNVTADVLRRKIESVFLGFPKCGFRPAVAAALGLTLFFSLYSGFRGIIGIFDTKSPMIVEVPSVQVPYNNGQEAMLSDYIQQPVSDEVEDRNTQREATDNQFIAAEDIRNNGVKAAIQETIPDDILAVTHIGTEEIPSSQPNVEKLIPSNIPSSAVSVVEVEEPKPVSYTVVTDKANVTDASQIVNFEGINIPEPKVFNPRVRIVNSSVIRISVNRIDSASSQIELLSQLFSVVPEKTLHELKDNGVLVKVFHYRIEDHLLGIMMARLSVIGDVIQQTKHSSDITSEYSKLLKEHKVLLTEVMKTGDRTKELNDIVIQLITMDKSSEPGMYNLVVWLEDAVDF